MAEALIDDFEDLLTCSVCLERFDNEVRKPKFLSCHHTLCLECVTSMGTRMLVTCPLCRKETHFGDNKYGLPNNNYVLQMIASQDRVLVKSAQSQQIASPNALAKKRWCLKCRKDASDLCTSSFDHEAILTSSSEFCLEILKSRDNNETKMAVIIEKRREAKKYMRRVCEALKFAEYELQQLEEDNDEHLAKMISLLEDAGARLNGPELTAECFAKKVDRYTEMIAQDVMQFEDSCLPHVQNTKIFVQFKNQDGKCLPYGFSLFDSGFSSAGGQQDQPNTLTAASHILLSLLTQLGIRNEPPMKPLRPENISNPLTIIPMTQNQRPIREIDFVLSMTYFNNNQNLGSVLVKPDCNFHRPFIDALTQAYFCRRKIKLQTIFMECKPSYSIAVEFNFPHYFHIAVPNLEHLMTIQSFETNQGAGLEEEFNDVRITKYSGNGTGVNCFTLEFLLVPSQTKKVSHNPLFGKIVKGWDVLKKLTIIPYFTHVSLQKQPDPSTSNQVLVVKPKKEKISKTNKRALVYSLAEQSNSTLPSITGRRNVPNHENLERGSSVFLMTFTHRNWCIGSVLVEPNKIFYRPFIEGLARFCQSPMLFEGKIEKAHPNFVTFEFSNKNFKQNVPNPKNFLTDSSKYDAEIALEVGFFDYKSEGSSVTDFQLMFLLGHFNPDHVKKCPLFGRIVGGVDVLRELSQKRMHERDGFTVSIEF